VLKLFLIIVAIKLQKKILG